MARASPATWTCAGLLAALLAAEIVLARVRHHSLPEVQERAATGTLEERLFALHVLANREPPGPVNEAFVAGMLASPDAPVRELAMTADFTRLVGKKEQRQHVRSAGGDEALRLDFLLRFQAQRMTRADLEAFLASCGDR